MQLTEDLHSRQLYKARVGATTALERSELVVDVHTIRHEYGGLLARIRVTKECIRCRNSYTGQSNLLEWGCSLHPGFLDSRTGSYTCCGSYNTTRGCVPCMHTEDYDRACNMKKNPLDDHVKIPVSLLNSGDVKYSKTMSSEKLREEHKSNSAVYIPINTVDSSKFYTW